MKTTAVILSEQLATLLTAVRQSGGVGAYVVVFPEGHGVLRLGRHPHPALRAAVDRLYPGGEWLRHITGQVDWRFRVERGAPGP